MTGQMADDEVLRVLDDVDALDAALFSQAADEYGDDMAMLIDFMGMGSPEELDKARNIMRAAIHASVAALQAERDALRKENETLKSADWYRAGVEQEQELIRAEQRAERAESALEALRGQVAGLVEKWRLEIEEYDTQNVGSSDPEDWMSGHRECLGELLAMKNSGEF